MSTVAIVDGNPLIWRAYDLYASLTTRSGIYTGCLFGALQNLVRGLESVKPDYFVVTWDIGKSRWRRELLPSYKSNRKYETEQNPKVPWEAVWHQMEVTRTILKHAGVTQIGIEGVEADDLIGLLATGFDKWGEYDDVVIMSQDHDLHQLVGGKIRQFDLVRKSWINREGVKQLNGGLAGKQLIEVKALMGDSGDEIPGVRGMGPSGAVNLIQKFGSVERVFSNESKFTVEAMGKKYASVLECKPVVELAKKLVTIPTSEDYLQLAPSEITQFLEQLKTKVTPNRMDFVGMSEQYELTKVLGKQEVLFRDPPNFTGFEEWFGHERAINQHA